MTKYIVVAIFLALTILLVWPALSDATGEPHAIDGDKIAIGNERIRLHGIDAPEADQTCTVDGEEWACGQMSKFALDYEMAEQQTTCKGDKRDSHGRLIAVCYVGPHDLNAIMVRKGWALAFRLYSMDYVDEENEARKAGRGIWRGEFIPPWEWRKR